MTNQDDYPMDPADLHQKVEVLAMERTAGPPDGSAALSLEEMRKTIHELRLQQMELERQIEELRTGQTQIKAEEALAHSEQLMRFVIEHTNSGVAIHDRNLDYLYVSQRYLDMYNVQEQEVLGKHHYEVFPDLPQQWREVHQKALAGEVSGSDRDPYVREDGTVEYTRWECRPWYEADGSVGGIIVYTEVITDLLQQEQSLREYAEKLGESEENLRITLRSIGDAVISTDVAGRVVAMNPVAESLTGWSEKEAFGQPLDEVFRIINEQTRQTVESPVTNVLKTGQIVGLANHTLLIAKDGNETPIADSGAPICNARGETTGVVLVFRDQTQERESRLVLEESEARLRRAQKVAQVGDWEFDLKTGKVNASESAKDIYGLYDLDLSIEDIQNVQLPQYRPLLDAAINGLIHDDKPYDVAFTIRHASDQTLVEIHSVAEYDPQTEIVSGIIQDITERKRAEEALKKSKMFLNSTIDSLTAHITVLDDRGGIILTNKAYRDFAAQNGIEPRTVSEGANYLAVCDTASGEHSEEATPFAEGIRDVLSGKRRSFKLEYPCHSPDEERWFIAHVTPFDSEGSRRVVVAHEIITERKRAEEAIKTAHKLLEVKNQELEQFVYIVSHDLKSPLVTVKTFAGMLRQDLLKGDQPQINEDLNYIDKAADKMQLLLDALLQYSRIGRIDTPAQTLSADHQVQNCLAALAGILQQQQVQVSIGKLPQLLHGGPLHFGQIWQNLIENAVKYRGDQSHPQIEIGATQEGQDVVFYVRDNGMGIEPKHNERIFNLFSQLHSGSDGSGLGLALVKKIVSIYQGRVWVESAGAGQGSCFMFTLPGAQVKEGTAI